jgi:hypothetical protein
MGRTNLAKSKSTGKVLSSLVAQSKPLAPSFLSGTCQTVHNVIATFTAEIIQATGADKNIVTAHCIEIQWIIIIPYRTTGSAVLNPVITGIADHRSVSFVTKDKIVIRAGKHFGNIVPGNHKITTCTGKN